MNTRDSVHFGVVDLIFWLGLIYLTYTVFQIIP